MKYSTWARRYERASDAKFKCQLRTTTTSIEYTYPNCHVGEDLIALRTDGLCTIQLRVVLCYCKRVVVRTPRPAFILPSVSLTCYLIDFSDQGASLELPSYTALTLMLCLSLTCPVSKSCTVLHRVCDMCDLA